MQLQLNLPAELMGRPNILPVDIGEPTQLTREDLNLLALRKPETGSRAPLKSIRQSHHHLARMLADGVADVDISATLGYSPSHIRLLSEDPSIMELVAHYRGRIEMEKADMHSLISSVANMAMVEIRERLETNPEEFTKGELFRLAEQTLDRAGFGPTSKVQVQTLDVNKLVNNLRQLTENERKGRVLSREDVINVTPQITDQSSMGEDSEGGTLPKEAA